MNKIIIREWFNHKIYPLLFMLCLTVSLGAYLTLDALQQSVDDYIDVNQKQMVGGDIVLKHNQAFPDDLVMRIQKLNPQDVVYDYQFNAIAYTKNKQENRSLLTRIKAVNSTYPLYGKLERTSSNNWTKGTVLVEKQVLNGLNVNIGDKLQIGEAQFQILDEIIAEPDRPLTAFGFGARIIMHDSDLDKTQLMGEKSRINYRIEIKTHDKDENIQLFAELKELITDSTINISTAENSSTSISNLSQNFLVFLKLLVIAVIILSGIGLMSVVRAFINTQKNTNAIRSAIGEPISQIVKSYRILLISMTLVSVFLAWLFSLLILYFGRDIFSAILPHDLLIHISNISLLKTFAIGMFLTLLMTHLSLNSIYNIKPVAVLHKHQQNKKNEHKPWLWLLAAALGLLLLLYSELHQIFRSVQIFVALILIWFIFSILTFILMKLIQLFLNKQWIKSWKLILALQNIFRKNNQSQLFVTALSLTSMILGSITLLDYSIQEQLISTYPEDAPNFFLLDIQKDQQEQLDEIFKGALTYYPVVRARIESVNGVKSDVLKDQLGRYDNIKRMFNLSYSNELLSTEKLYKSAEANQLFSALNTLENTTDTVPVSILNSFAEFLQVGLGDTVVFNIQGIKINTKISSVRKRLKRGPSPFFYFIFPPQVLAQAPQIRFATAQIPKQQRAILQTQIAQKFPGITTLDGANIAHKLKGFTDQLKALVEIFTALSLFAGLLIFLTSLISTSQDRLKESFYYRMMGMQSADLLKLTLIEFLSLGLFALNLGISIAAVTSFLISHYWFSLNFIFPWHIFAVANISFAIILIVISLVYNAHVKKTNITKFLQHESH
jgi:putative ABC transport system permease protein